MNNPCEAAPDIKEETNPSVADWSTREKLKDDLFRYAMKSDWNAVVDIYDKVKEARQVVITKLGDTAIHIAVADGREDIVEKLVKCVSPEDLKIKNELGNTPLHQAAILGNVSMCKCIADKDPPLVGIPNKDDETPFFLAVLHGNKEAFLCLHSIISKSDNKEEADRYCRKKGDGDTILHAAIYGEYFDLAFQIIHCYKKKLIDKVNAHGISPLHLLANKPSAFRSGSHISGFRKLIYHCIFVEKLKPQSSKHILSQDLEYHPKARYPENYHTCIGLICFLRNIFNILVGKSSSQNDAENPPEEPSAINKQGDKSNPQDYAGNPIETQTVTKQDGSSECVDKQEAHAGSVQSDIEKGKRSKILKAQAHQFFPENYRTCFDGLKLLSKVLMIILGVGSTEIKKLREKKEKHIWSVQILGKLLETATWYEYEYNGGNPPHLKPATDEETSPYDLGDGGDVRFMNENWLAPDDDSPASLVNDSTGAELGKASQGSLGTNGNGKTAKSLEMEKKEESPILLIAANNALTEMRKVLLENKLVDENLGTNKIALMFLSGKTENALEWEKKETPILIAAKNGIMEIVRLILDLFPVAIHDMNSDKKNIVLLAVEHRQPHVYNFVQNHSMKEAILRKTDKDGNSALHLAAMLRDHQPWCTPGAALQMQWELKWFKFVKDSMPLHFFRRYNKIGEIPRQIFTETHKDLVRDGGKWLTDTSQSCSLVAALIATVAFATSSTVPGGVDEEEGTPILENQSGFSVFAIASLIALSFSVTSLVMFLSILTSRYQEKDFAKSLPRKLLVGMSSLFVSIASMLVSFCAGHFFVLRQKLQFVALPVYAITCLPVTFFAILQFPLYVDLVRATFTKVPQRSYK